MSFVSSSFVICFSADSPLEIDGDYYLVERYESDVEDEKEEKDQVFVRISDKFLEEINTDGNVSTLLEYCCN